ncbi:SAV_2336 N-terminal domain-related protein [Streptomyces naphthomycinicus]|uniref:SAV_2336 N-terminal domain-related protein n=1 Tax=Streptomyces naphthomycinicus TaxID=2872625 RepID=UPI001CED9E48|nr:SAV_2336 N-terminal domain-related protein [Streptomyces sp. TML10]
MSSESSERPGSPDPLARLADVLAEAAHGVRPTPRELAEVLWLAGHMSPGPDDHAPVAPRAPAPAPPPRPPRAEPPAPEPARPPGPARAPEPPARVPLHLPSRRPAPAPDRPHTTLLAPAPPMLRHPLALQRALRPLARRTDAPVGHELDERATADRIARLGAGPEGWLPVLRPARERWLRLNLVYDAGPTMPLWRPLVRELHTALAQSGAFRTVALYRAAADGTVRGPGAHAPADGRTVTLLVSDCMGPQWREGPAGTRWYATLHRWARRMPLAVVQPLPEHLWRDTALPTVPGTLSAPRPAAPTATLTFTPYERPEPDEPHERDEVHASAVAGGAVPLPVLEPEPRWLAHWAGLLTTPGGARFPGAAAWLDRPLPADAEDRTDVGLLSAEELVLRFRATASPEAFRLAGHLAVGRPDLPVMRLVQAAVEPDPRPRHLAEVVLSGMLAAVPDAPSGSYAFRDGVRELLLLGLPRTARHRTAELLGRMGEFIDRRAGRAPGEFRASVPAAKGAGAAVEGAGAGVEGAGAAVEGEPFATVTEDSVRRLSTAGAGTLFAGRYRLVRQAADGPGRLAEDTRRGDALVVLRGYPPPRLRASFTELCRRLGTVRHPGIAPVLDHGFEDGAPYLVREFVAGRTLRQRLDDAPEGLPAGEVTALLPPLAAAVLALTGHEGPHGVLDTRSVVLTANGPVLTCLDSAPAVPGSRAKSLRSLGGITRALYRGSGALGAELDAAASALLSGDPRAQRRGAERLLRLAPHHAPEDRPEIHFRTDTLTGRPEARIALEAAVHEILARGSLTPRQYAVLVRPDGYLVRAEPGVFLLPVLVAVLRELPQARARLADPPQLRVTFGSVPFPALPPKQAADAVVLVPTALYDDFAASSAAQGPLRFRPLYGDDAPDAPPAAWYCVLAPASPAPGATDLVQGPFITRDLRELGIPAPGRTAVVHTRSDGPLTLLNPFRPDSARPPRPETYYSVDLTPHQARHTVSLPSSGSGAFTAAVELTWHVDDPVAFVRADVTGVEGLLLEHVRGEAARLTRRHPVRRAGAAQRQVNQAVRTWPVPGLAVSYTVQLSPEGSPLPMTDGRSAPARRRLAALLGDAEAVLIGFDGPLARLFSAQTARAAALDLLSVATEHRDPADALGGRPPAGTGGREALVHPLDVLRAFAHDRLGPLLRARLDELELAAVPDAPTTHRSLALVRTLHRSGRRVGVVTDVSPHAARRYLEPYRLPLSASVQGRGEDLGLLTPHPDCLRRALDALGAPAGSAVLISSSVAELAAAQQLGLRFIGYAPTATGRRALREGGGEVTVSSLEPLWEAAGSL